MPAMAHFCTSSKLQRLDISTKPCARSCAVAGQRADQLVQRVVAADILARQQDFSVHGAPGGGMHRAVHSVHRLVARQFGIGAGHGLGRERHVGHAMARHADRVAHVLDAAEAAAGAALEAAPRHAAAVELLLGNGKIDGVALARWAAPERRRCRKPWRRGLRPARSRPRSPRRSAGVAIMTA